MMMYFNDILLFADSEEQEQIRAQRIQSTITLNTTETSDETQQWFQIETNENVAINIQKAIKSRLNVSCAIRVIELL